MTEEFLNIPYEKSSEFFDYFLKYYLGTDDKEIIKKEDEKIKLLAFLRIYYHYKRRKKNEDDYKEQLEFLLNEIKALASRVNNCNIGK